jgi:hypothetical protein
MKSASIRELKKELEDRTPKEVLELCLRLARFKKENKELLTYLLFESSDEEAYIEGVKELLDERFENVNRKSPYFVKKSIRAILSLNRKYIRYSGKKETEVELILYFCSKMKDFRPSVFSNRKLDALYNRLLEQGRDRIRKLHPDLQYDYRLILKQLE